MPVTIKFPVSFTTRHTKGAKLEVSASNMGQSSYPMRMVGGDVQEVDIETIRQTLARAVKDAFAGLGIEIDEQK